MYKLSTISEYVPIGAHLEIFKWTSLGENARLYIIEARPFSVIELLLLISIYLIYLALISPSVNSLA